MTVYRKKIIVFALVLLFTVSAIKAETVNKRTKIDFYSNELNDSINVIIRINGNVYGADGKEDVNYVDQVQVQKEILANNFTKNGSNHFYKFNWDNIMVPKYCSIYSPGMSLGARKIAFDFILVPGDQVFISEKNDQLFFRGKDAKKYELEYKLYWIFRNQPISMYSFGSDANNGDIKKTEIYFKQVDSLAKRQKTILERYKNFVTKETYWLTKSNISCFYEVGWKLRFLNNAYWINSKIPFYEKNNAPILKFLKEYKNPLWNYKIKTEYDHLPELRHSLNYLDLQMQEYVIDSCFLKRKSYNIADCYKYFVHKYSGNIREWLIYRIIEDAQENKTIDNDFTFCVEDAFSKGYIRNESIKTVLNQFKTFNVPGAAAFNFALSDVSKHLINLSDFKGKTVVLDFWFIGCGNCARLHPILDSIEHSPTGERFTLVSICIDYTGKSKAGWVSAIESNKYTTPTNINLFAPGNAGQDPLIAKRFNIDACPALIIVDKNGKLTRRPTDPRIDNGDDLISIINEQDKLK